MTGMARTQALPGRFARKYGLLCTASVCLCVGCSRASPFRAVEHSIQAELPRMIGPADRYQVSVSRSGGSLLAGRIPWVEIEGRNVRAIEGLNLDRLHVRLEEVRFRRSDHTVEEIGQTRFEAGLGADSVTRFVQRRSPGLRDVRVRFSSGLVRVHATPALLGIGFPLEIEGRPVLHGTTAINFDASRVALLRLGLPEFAVRRLEAQVNPLVDLATMPFPLQLTAVQIAGNQAVITGTATLIPANFSRR
jgi:hypothetical protein